MYLSFLVNLRDLHICIILYYLESPSAYEEAMSTLFIPESGNVLAKTLQVITEDNRGIET